MEKKTLDVVARRFFPGEIAPRGRLRRSGNKSSNLFLC